MLIDQFTPEQIAQIRKELKMTENSQKQKATNLKYKLRQIFPVVEGRSPEEESLWYARMGIDNLIYQIVDLTMRNTTYIKKTARTTSKDTVRSSLIPGSLEEEYVWFVDEILGLIEKHKK